MKLQIIIIFFFSFLSFAQNDNSENEIYLSSVVDKKPEFQGGITELYRYIGENMDLPVNDFFLGGRLTVSFTVNTDGVLSDIKVIKGFGLTIDNEIIRLLNSCKNWFPGEIDSKKVRVNYVLPILLPKSEVEIKDIFTKKDSVFSDKDIDVKPDFVGGVNAFYNFVGREFKVPMVEGLKGKVFATFIIEKDGSITDIKIIKDEVGHGCSEEFIRVLKVSPKWIPGLKNGIPIRVVYSMPINIQGSGGPPNEIIFYDIEVLDPNGKPKYPDGLEAFYSYILTNLDKNKLKAYQGKLNVYFTISDEGKILKVHVEEKVTKEIYNEISRVVKLSKNWIPAIRFGLKVNCYYRLPIAIGY